MNPDILALAHIGDYVETRLGFVHRVERSIWSNERRIWVINGIHYEVDGRYPAPHVDKDHGSDIVKLYTQREIVNKLVNALSLCVRSIDNLLPGARHIVADIGLINEALLASRNLIDTLKED